MSDEIRRVPHLLGIDDLVGYRCVPIRVHAVASLSCGKKL
jgi:hypothetical protein